MGDIFIRYTTGMPASIKAYTLTDSDGNYNVYVNTALNSIRQQEAIEHEMRHIEGGHFFRGTSVKKDEQEAENRILHSTRL